VLWTCKYIVRVHTKTHANEILDDIDRRWVVYLLDTNIVTKLSHRIALTPPFPGLQHFKHGRQFKQWMGDDSKALMKVRKTVGVHL
jgi:hypothetical protein